MTDDLVGRFASVVTGRLIIRFASRRVVTRRTATSARRDILRGVDLAGATANSGTSEGCRTGSRSAR